MMSMEEIQNWWKIPCVVHFCDIFSNIYSSILKISIDEFEVAVRDNSNILSDIALRFYTAIGIKKTEYWKEIKKLIESNWHDKDFIYSVGPVEYIDELTSKQKVEVIYILGHLMLEIEKPRKIFFHKIHEFPEINLSLKPFGYDQKKSVYWYFGNSRLYREEFKNVPDILVKSHINLTSAEPYPPEVFGSGIWTLICDDDKSWFSLVNTLKRSKNINEISLLKSINNIVENFPKLKKYKRPYKLSNPPIRPRTILYETRNRSMNKLKNDKLNQPITDSLTGNGDLLNEADTNNLSHSNLVNTKRTQYKTDQNVNCSYSYEIQDCFKRQVQVRLKKLNLKY